VIPGGRPVSIALFLSFIIVAVYIANKYVAGAGKFKETWKQIIS